MKNLIIPVKTDAATKKRFQSVAREMGFGASTLLNAYMKQVIKDKVVHFSLVKTFPEKTNPVLTLPEIKKKILPILRKHKVKKAAIFGSHARGEAGPDSDVDVLADLPEGLSLLDVSGIQIELEEALGKKVDFVQYGYIRPELKDNILKDQIKIL